MRYLVRARVKAGCEVALLEAFETGELGRGSVAWDQYSRSLEAARRFDDGTVRWVEVCYCPSPLLEERPYWEEYFDLLAVKDAHARSTCLDENGTKPWACDDCDCTARLEAQLAARGSRFLDGLTRAGRGRRDRT